MQLNLDRGMKNPIDCDGFCNEALNLDKSIRYVAVVNDGKTYAKMAQTTKNLLNPKESSESINDAIPRWKTRKKLAVKLGEPVYAMAVYKKIKRITLPFDQNGVILVSMNPDGFHQIIIDELAEIKYKYFDA